VPTASNLHVLRIDVDLADFSEVFAKGTVERPITRCIVGGVCTCTIQYNYLHHHTNNGALTQFYFNFPLAKSLKDEFS
jgi:hypothetical protein